MSNSIYVLYHHASNLYKTKSNRKICYWSISNSVIISILFQWQLARGRNNYRARQFFKQGIVAFNTSLYKGNEQISFSGISKLRRHRIIDFKTRQHQTTNKFSRLFRAPRAVLLIQLLMHADTILIDYLHSFFKFTKSYRDMIRTT